MPSRTASKGPLVIRRWVLHLFLLILILFRPRGYHAALVGCLWALWSCVDHRGRLGAVVASRQGRSCTYKALHNCICKSSWGKSGRSPRPPPSSPQIQPLLSSSFSPRGSWGSLGDLVRSSFGSWAIADINSCLFFWGHLEGPRRPSCVPASRVGGSYAVYGPFWAVGSPSGGTLGTSRGSCWRARERFRALSVGSVEAF